MSIQLESVPSLQRHTTALGLRSPEILLVQQGKRCCYPPEPGGSKVCSPAESKGPDHTLNPQSPPYFSSPGPRGGKAKHAKDRTAPQVRAIFSSISSSIRSQLPWLLQDVGIFVMEILYATTTGPKAAYTGPQLNSAAGTEHIPL